MPALPRLISSEIGYRGRLFDVSVDTIEMGTGAVAKREIIRHPGAVAIVPVTMEGHLLLVRQYRHAAGRRLLELPAGTLEAGEDPAETAHRELQEEVGMAPGALEPLGGLFVAPGYTDEYIHLFVATGLSESRLDGDEDEDIEVEALSIEQALAAIDSGEICDAKSIAGILRWLRRENR